MMRQISLFVLVFALALTGVAKGGINTWYGIDAGAGPADLRPNSDATAAAWALDAAGIGPLSVIDFESLAIGDFLSMEIAPGVTATLTGTDFGITDSGIQPTGWLGGDDTSLGYNTTTGGSQILAVVPEFDVGTTMLTLDFDTPILAMGSYLTGLGTANGDLFVEFTNGGPQMINVVGSPSGGVLFWGFTDPDGGGISTITLSLQNVFGSRDIFAVDDLSFVYVPAPATAALLVVAGLGLVRRRRT